MIYKKPLLKDKYIFKRVEVLFFILPLGLLFIFYFILSLDSAIFLNRIQNNIIFVGSSTYKQDIVFYQLAFASIGTLLYWNIKIIILQLKKQHIDINHLLYLSSHVLLFTLIIIVKISYYIKLPYFYFVQLLSVMAIPILENYIACIFICIIIEVIWLRNHFLDFIKGV